VSLRFFPSRAPATIHVFINTIQAQSHGAIHVQSTSVVLPMVSLVHVSFPLLDTSPPLINAPTPRITVLNLLPIHNAFTVGAAAASR
jgi:hypothetical protein